MVFTVTPEQDALRGAVRSFVRSAVTEADTRRTVDSPEGYDRAVWLRMATELGLQGLVVGEAFGGAGAGVEELAIAVDELGAALYSGPFLSTALATLAIVESGDESAQKEFLPGIAAGTTTATLASAGPAGSWTSDVHGCTAEHGPDGWTLTGTHRYVTDAEHVDLLVVATDAGLFVLDRHTSGVRVTPVQAFDLTRPLATVEFAAAQARPLGEPGTDVLGRVLQLASTLAAVEAVGGAQTALDLTVAYAKERVQFGRVIGSFQAVKHLCADTLLDVESARSAAYYAAWAAATRSAELDTVAPLAKAYCTDVFFESAVTMMQVHGGISFTWEHPCHLYYRRAKSARQLWGDPASHRERLAERIGL